MNILYHGHWYLQHKNMGKTEDILRREELFRELHGTNERERTLHRLHCVSLVLHGFLPKDVAKMYGDSPRAVAYWATRFGTKGVAGLVEQKREGKAPRLKALQLKRLKAWVRAKRSAGEVISSRELSLEIKKVFEVKLSSRQCRRILAAIE